MLTQHKMGSLQDLPHVDMMSPITKFAATVPSTGRVADMVWMAAREAFNGAPGPAYLEIPRDVLDREIDLSKAVIPQPGRYRASTKSVGDPRAIEQLADLLVNSERPAILYGQQVWTARGHEEEPSRCCAASTFLVTSTARAVACCRRAIRITSIARVRRLSPRPI